MNKSKIRKAMSSIDNYLDGLSYKKLVSERPDRLYEKLFHDIASIVIGYYEDVDVTKNTELSVATDTTNEGVRVCVTGYVKVDDNHYLQIEKTYLPEESK